MTLAEKLRFLADRAEDGLEFYWGDLTMRIDSQNMIVENIDGEWIDSFRMSTINYRDVELKQQLDFTEDEKAILRNLPTEYHWIARDDIFQGLFVYTSKPTKFEHSWADSMGSLTSLSGFRHLFESIKWTDDEPCEFRKYL